MLLFQEFYTLKFRQQDTRQIVSSLSQPNSYNTHSFSLIVSFAGAARFLYLPSVSISVYTHIKTEKSIMRYPDFKEASQPIS